MSKTLNIIAKDLNRRFLRASAGKATVKLDDVQDRLGIERSLMDEGLTDLQNFGILKVIDENDNEIPLPSDATALIFSGYCITARPLRQPALDECEPLTRSESGTETIKVDDDVFKVTVLPERTGTDGHSGRYLLSVCRNPGTAEAHFVIADKVFDDKELAWIEWDEIKDQLQRDAKTIQLPDAPKGRKKKVATD